MDAADTMGTEPPTLESVGKPRVRTFYLPLEQIHRVKEAGGPLAEADLESIRKDAIIPVVEVDGKIVAYWVLFFGLHAEPLWVHPDHRGSAGVIGGILDQTEEGIKALNEDVVFCIIEDETLDVVREYASRLGFVKVPGDLYFLLRKGV